MMKKTCFINNDGYICIVVGEENKGDAENLKE